MKRGSTVRTFLFVAAAAATVSEPAAASCLMEYDACSGCAQTMLWDGMKTMNPSMVRDANLYLAECSIDLWYCMLFGNHHAYRCTL